MVHALAGSADVARGLAGGCCELRGRRVRSHRPCASCSCGRPRRPGRRRPAIGSSGTGRRWTSRSGRASSSSWTRTSRSESRTSTGSSRRAATGTRPHPRRGGHGAAAAGGSRPPRRGVRGRDDRRVGDVDRGGLRHREPASREARHRSMVVRVDVRRRWRHLLLVVVGARGRDRGARRTLAWRGGRTPARCGAGGRCRRRSISISRLST